MIRMQRPMLFFFMCCATVFLMPFLFMVSEPMDADEVSLVGVVLLLGEVAAYALWIGLFTQVNLIILAAVPVGLAIGRMLLAALGAVYVNLMGIGPGGDAFMVLWLGQPLAVVLQVLVFIFVLPYFLAVMAPGVLTDTIFESIIGHESPHAAPVEKPAAASPANKDITPTGGVLQIYTLEDIPKFFEKVAGLEGYAIYTNEGLLFCHNLDEEQRVERLGVRVQQCLDSMRTTAHDCDLEEPSRLILESDNFSMFLTPITPHFWGLFIFNKNVSLDNCHGKIKVLANSVKSFFTTRYVIS